MVSEMLEVKTVFHFQHFLFHLSVSEAKTDFSQGHPPFIFSALR